MPNTQWAKDAAERVFWTAVQVVLAAVLTTLTGTLVGAETLNSDVVKAAVMAAYGAGLAALKAFVAKSIPGTISPASTVKADT